MKENENFEISIRGSMKEGKPVQVKVSATGEEVIWAIMHLAYSLIIENVLSEDIMVAAIRAGVSEANRKMLANKKKETKNTEILNYIEKLSKLISEVNDDFDGVL